MHERTVSVAIHMGSKALVPLTPRHCTDLSGRHPPAAEVLEMIEGMQRGLVAREVHASVAKERPSAEVNWNIDEVVDVSIPFLIQERNQMIP